MSRNSNRFFAIIVNSMPIAMWAYLQEEKLIKRASEVEKCAMIFRLWALEMFRLAERYEREDDDE